MTRFLPAAALSLLIFGLAPFMGQVRDAFFAAFPKNAVPLLGKLFLAAGLVLFLGALVRIRRHNFGWRLGGLATVLILLLIQLVGGARGIAEVDIVERFHIIEYGSLAFLLYRAFKQAGVGWLTLVVQPILWSAIVGTIDELVQWWVALRVGDAYDVWLNSFAAICGLIFAWTIDPPQGLSRKVTKHELAAAARCLALLVAAIALFVDVAHLGYLIVDPQVGSFRSWHSPEELKAAAADRARRWPVSPPNFGAVLQREDFFITEAGWHVQHRNQRLSAGDFATALAANRIAEAYYQPFLDLNTWRGGSGHRWPAATLADVLSKVDPEKKASTSNSPVLEERVWLVPKKKWRLTTSGIVGALLLCSIYWSRSSRRS